MWINGRTSGRGLWEQNAAENTGQKREYVCSKDTGEKRIMMSFIIFTLHQILLSQYFDLAMYRMVCGSNPNGAKGLLSSPEHFDQLWGWPSLAFSGYQCFFLGAKQPRHETNHFPPPSTEVRNEWTYTSIPPHTFMAWKGKLLPFYL
jgi:hypothetical protein